MSPTLVLVVLLAFGCSSKKKSGTGDAGADVSAAGDTAKLLDSRGGGDARSDQARVTEVGVPDVSTDRGGGGDTRDGMALRDVRDGKADDAGIDVPVTPEDDGGANDGGSKIVDAKEKQDGRSDAPMNKDTNPGIKKNDAAPDVPPPNGCLNPIVISSVTPQVDLTVSTVGETHKFDLPCGATGPDVVLWVTLVQNELIYADTFGASWNTVLHFSETCPPSPESGDPVPGTVACSDDACGTTQSQALTVAANPGYYLFLSGANGASGTATLHFQHAAIGTGLLKQLGAGAGTVTGTTDRNTTTPSDVCEAAGGTDNYWWSTCPDYAGGDLSASTCTGTTFDTLVALQVPRTALVVCEDDTDPCGIQSLLHATVPAGAGLNVVSIFGGTNRAFGPYVLTYTRP